MHSTNSRHHLHRSIDDQGTIRPVLSIPRYETTLLWYQYTLWDKGPRCDYHIDPSLNNSCNRADEGDSPHVQKKGDNKMTWDSLPKSVQLQ
eukprot:492675-Ditylum_brightwellii.AAC.2